MLPTRLIYVRSLLSFDSAPTTYITASLLPPRRYSRTDSLVSAYCSALTPRNNYSHKQPYYQNTAFSSSTAKARV